MRLMKYLILPLVLLFACANLSAEQRFEQGVRSYETALVGAHAYYDADADGFTTRAVSNAEVRAFETFVVGGRGIRRSGMQLVLDCREETSVTGKKCSTSTLIIHSADALNDIALGIAELYLGDGRE